MKKLATLFTALTLSYAAMAEVNVTDAYARAVPPGQPNSAAFLTLKNTDADQIALLSASSSAAKVVELHSHSHDNGVMKMRKLPQITLNGHETVTLKPGGLHIMLIGLNDNLVKGEDIDLTLNFSDGSIQTLDVTVKDVMAAMGKHHHHH